MRLLSHLYNYECYLRKLVLDPRALATPFVLSGVYFFKPNKDIADEAVTGEQDSGNLLLSGTLLNLLKLERDMLPGAPVYNKNYYIEK